MKFKISRTWGGDLSKYVDQLRDFKFKSLEDRSHSGYIRLGEIELENIDDVVSLMNSVNCKIIFKYEAEIEIYDDHRE